MALLGASALFAGNSHADYGGYAHGEVLLYSEPVSIDAAIDDWDGDFKGGEIQWAYAWAEAGVKWKQWSLGALYRHEIALLFDRDTAELYYRTEHDLPLDTGREYRIDIEAQRFSARGLRAAWRLDPTPEFQLAIGASLFNTQHLQDGRLQGEAIGTGGDDYSFRGAIRYRYDEDHVFRHDADAPDGRGWAVDLYMRWHREDLFDVSLKIVDLLGKIHWDDAPYTNAEGFSAEGIGGLVGVMGEKDHTQDLEPRFDLNAGVTITGPFEGKGRLLCQYGECLYGLGFGTPYTRVLYWPDTEGFELRLGNHRYYVALMTDDIDPKDMHSAYISFGLNLP